MSEKQSSRKLVWARLEIIGLARQLDDARADLDDLKARMKVLLDDSGVAKRDPLLRAKIMRLIA